MTSKPLPPPRVHLATIGAPFGVKGAFRLKTFTEHPKSVLSYGSLFDNTGKVYTFQMLRVEEPSTLVVKESSVMDRTDAQKLRGTKLYVFKENLPSSTPPVDHTIQEDTFYQHELLGINVVEENGASIGEVTSVENYGASDILIIKTQNGEKQAPFIKDAVLSVDLSKGILVLAKAFLI